MQEQQDQYTVQMLGMKTLFYNENSQRLTTKIEDPVMPTINFDTTTNTISNTSQYTSQNKITGLIIPDYIFKSKGKYTNQFFSNANKNSDARQPFKFDDHLENKCSMHGGYNDIVVVEPFGKYTKYQAICRYCESEYNRQRKAAGINSKDGCVLMIDVIKDNVDKIINIRNGQQSFTNETDTYKCTTLLYDDLMPLADELIDIVNDFNEEVLSKFYGSGADNEELLKIKSFIDQIPLINGIETNVNKIEEDPDKKIKYVKLAIFLLNFTKIDSGNVDYSHVSYRLKEHILRIVSLRKCIVTQITKWLKFLLGDFYDFVFRAEGLPVDEDLRRSIKVDFFSDEEIRKITYIFECEIYKRDARIRLLEEENERYKRELESLRGNLSYMSDQESLLNDLQLKFQKIEVEWGLQKQQIGNLIAENNSLITQNSEYFNQINSLNNDIETMRNNFENTLKTTIYELRMQYEVQIIKISEDFNDLKNRYQSDAKQWMSERDSLINNMQNMITEINGQKEKISLQITEINNLNSQWQRTKNELVVIMQERDSHLRTIDSLRIEIKNYQANITNLNNQLTIVLKARDQLCLQVDHLDREISQLRSNIMQITNELQICNQKNEMYVNNITIITKERDEYKQQLFIFRGDLEKKNAEYQTLANIRISLENRVNQLEGEIRRITEVYTKLQYDFNQKVVIIGDMDKRIREIEGLNFSNQNQNEMYIVNIEKYEKLLIQINEDHLQKVTQLEKIIADFRDKQRELTMQLKERDNETSRLKITITSCKEDWNKLSESYESLLSDIKNQINVNEVLKNLVFELLNKIQMHNQNVGGLDIAIKQQIEILTRQSLAKKAIDIERNYNQDLSQATSNIDNLRMKLGRIESQKLTKSAVFNTLNFSNENLKSSSNTTLEEINQRFQRNNNISRQSTVNVDIQKYIDTAGFNLGAFTPFSNTFDNKKMSESVVREVNSNSIETHYKKIETTVFDTNSFKNELTRDVQSRKVLDTTEIFNDTVVLNNDGQ
jgi:uncharacterized coiled-coil DUF342 family protein